MTLDNRSNAISRGEIIRNARKKKNLTQLECAKRLGISDKTFRSYENNEVVRVDFDLLRRITLLLEIAPEQFDLPMKKIYTAEDANHFLAQGWQNLEQGDFNGAYHVGETLVSCLNNQISDIDVLLMRPLAFAHFLAGHANTIINDNREVSQAFEHYKQMENIAIALNDVTLLSIARTYQGEMLRRDNKFGAAIQTISAAPHNPEVDIAVRGNRSQLLARAYSSQGDMQNFKEQMRRAEDLAQEINLTMSNIYIPYNLGSVYEEYARVFAQYGNIKESRKYIELAEKTIPQTPRWVTLTKLTKGEVLIRATVTSERKHPNSVKQVGDFKNGIALIGESVQLAHLYGHKRLLRRAYNLKTSFTRQAAIAHVVVSMLDEVLEKSITDEQVMIDEY